MKFFLNFINESKTPFDDNILADFNNVVVKVIQVLNIKKPISLSVSLVSSYKIKKINKQYRNINEKTDVLSFPFEDNLNEEIKQKLYEQSSYVELGDIFICYQVAKTQAKKYGHSLQRELAFLFVHGLLHLLGYDHDNEIKEKQMFQLQEKILKQINLGRE